MRLKQLFTLLCLTLAYSIQAQPTQLTSAYCDVTLTDLSDYIYCDFVSGATHYQFRWEENSNVTNYISTSGAKMKPSWLTGIQYGLTYEVTVRAKVGGVWQPFGSACDVTTPATIPTTQLTTAYCNVLLTDNSDYVYADGVAAATDYQFKWTYNGNDEFYTSSGGAKMKPEWIPALDEGLTYDVTVRAKAGGVWGAWGSSCQVTLHVPPSAVNYPECNTLLPNLTNPIMVDALPGADTYEFTFDGPTTIVHSSSTPSVTPKDIGLADDALYKLTMRTKKNGTWSPSGPECHFRSPVVLPNCNSDITHFMDSGDHANDEFDINDYELIFHSDFDQPAEEFDPVCNGNGRHNDKWVPYHGIKECDNYNLIMRDQDLAQTNLLSGNLELTFKPLDKTQPGVTYSHWDSNCNQQGEYWSIYSEVRSKLRFKYGYFEARCQIPVGRHQWPAFWMYGQGTLPDGTNTAGEIDMFEIYPDEIGTSVVETNVFYRSDAIDDDYLQVGHMKHHLMAEEDNLSNEMHIYAVDWQPNKLTFYVDGQVVRTVNKIWVDSLPTPQWMDVSELLIDDMEILLSNAFHGWDEFWSTNEVTNEGTFLVDYVSVYKKKPQITEGAANCRTGIMTYYPVSVPGDDFTWTLNPSNAGTISINPNNFMAIDIDLNPAYENQPVTLTLEAEQELEVYDDPCTWNFTPVTYTTSTTIPIMELDSTVTLGSLYCIGSNLSMYVLANEPNYTHSWALHVIDPVLGESLNPVQTGNANDITLNVLQIGKSYVLKHTISGSSCHLDAYSESFFDVTEEKITEFDISDPVCWNNAGNYGIRVIAASPNLIGGNEWSIVTADSNGNPTGTWSTPTTGSNFATYYDLIPGEWYIIKHRVDGSAGSGGECIGQPFLEEEKHFYVPSVSKEARQPWIVDTWAAGNDLGVHSYHNLAYDGNGILYEQRIFEYTGPNPLTTIDEDYFSDDHFDNGNPLFTVTPNANHTWYVPYGGNYLVASAIHGPCAEWDEFRTIIWNDLVYKESDLKPKNDVQFTIFPNPSNGQYSLEIKEGEHPKGITIYDAVGKLVWASSTINKKGMIEIDISNQANGVYLVKLQFENDVAFRKVMKQ